MFRNQRRKNKILPEETAKQLLKTERRGVFAVNGDDGYPYAVPVNFYYDEENGRILFHGSKVGHKAESVKKDNKCCFTVYGNETVKEGEEWAPFLQSVVIFGRCRLVSDFEEAMSLLQPVAAKYYPGQEEIDEEIAKDGRGVQMYEITIEHLSGKFIQER